MTVEQHWLANFAHRLQREPAFMSFLLREFAGAEGLSEAELARQLRTDVVGYQRLAMCRRPRSAPEHFATDVARLAVACGADSAELLRVVRQAEALLALQQLTASQPVESGERSWTAASSLLAAARDHENEDDELQPPEPPAAPIAEVID